MNKPVTSLTLHDLGFQLPDGRWLFDRLNAQFDAQATGLVGRNGIGKSVLARILAGQLAPTRGHCERRGQVRYLGQQITVSAQDNVASLAGLQHTLAALDRIENGSSATADFDLLAERWDLRERLREQLASHGLGHLQATTPAAQLSGGERSRVVLLGAFFSGADMLILDEPSNHLDRYQRAQLGKQLQRWNRGLIVISHDRALLETMSSIVELSTQGLQRYGGAYTFYAAASAATRARAREELEQQRQERRRGERTLVEQRERLARREARNRRQAATANEAAILLGLRKSKSEQSTGKARAQLSAEQAALSQAVRDAAARVEDETPPLLFSPETPVPHGELVAIMEDVVLPYPRDAARPLNLQLRAGQRIALCGDNGCGKSTLLKMLAGESPVLSGKRELRVPAAYLDQDLSLLDARPLIEQLCQANPRAAESGLRTRLALLGLDASHVSQPATALSGGERMKAALARVLYSERPAQLLLLDEPDNHLDLAAQDALAVMLAQYRGTLLIVSHDDSLLGRLALDGRLRREAGGWMLLPC